MTALILERYALFKGNTAKAAKSLKVRHQYFAKEYSRIVDDREKERRRIKKEKEEAALALKKLKESEEAVYTDPTPSQRDEWYNRDRF